MGIIPKREIKSAWLHLVVTPTMDKKLRAFAKRNGVSRSEAARFIIENFFENNLENSEATPPKNEIDFEIIKVVNR